MLGVLTTLIAVPLGVAFALGLDRWHGRLPRAANFTMLMSFVVPEIVLGVSLFFVVTQVTSASVRFLAAARRDRGAGASGWSRSRSPTPSSSCAPGC